MDIKKDAIEAACKFKIGQHVRCLSVGEHECCATILTVVTRGIHECHGGIQQDYICQGNEKIHRLNESSLMSEEEYLNWIIDVAIPRSDLIRKAEKNACSQTEKTSGTSPSRVSQ